MERHGDEVDLTTTEARAGATPHIVRYVLAASLILAIAAMSIVWITGAVNHKAEVEQAARAPVPYEQGLADAERAAEKK